MTVPRRQFFDYLLRHVHLYLVHLRDRGDSLAEFESQYREIGIQRDAKRGLIPRHKSWRARLVTAEDFTSPLVTTALRATILLWADTNGALDSDCHEREAT